MDSRPTDDRLATLQRVCEALAAGSEGLLSWEWDDRFGAALSVTKDPQHQQVLALLAAQFPHAWDHESIQQAGSLIAQLSEAWGGLRPGQRMFTLAEDADPLLFACWWPWGTGTTFSLRVAAVCSDQVAALDPMATLRACFGI